MPEWLKGADCKSASESLRWFESISTHHLFSTTEGAERLPFLLGVVSVTGGSVVLSVARIVRVVKWVILAFLPVLSGGPDIPVWASSFGL